ncbi:glycosyltransferase [Gillisia marina]|uniref:glycosyltransferase n=1 Tax=Gillisia marina TaxID=1167637 RepID=UPI0002F419F1|nr:glycosyltransferase [Gillisia marina]
MKIGIVCYPTFGGSGVVATELGMELSKRGHEIHFITYKQPVRLEQLTGNIKFHEVNVPEYPLFHFQPYELALSSKLVNMVKLHKIEVLHVHYAIPHAYAGYMAKKNVRRRRNIHSYGNHAAWYGYYFGWKSPFLQTSGYF